MKFLLSVMAAAIIFATTSHAQTVEAPGKLTYKMPSGELVTRDATLILPAMGQGEVILRSASADIVAEQFFSEQRHGRVVFYVVFADFPGSTPETKSVFRGTYLRGSNQALYWGDVFIFNTEDDVDFSLLETESASGTFDHVAGFMFKADIAE